MTKIIKVFVVVFIVLLSIIILYKNINIFLLKTNLNIDIPNIKNFNWAYNSNNQDNSIEIIELRRNTTFIKISKINDVGKESSEYYINYQLTMINSVFELKTSPYPGIITREIVCPEELKPVEVNTTELNSTYYLMYSTNRYSYGACSWDSIKYRVIFLFRYCENKKELYQLEIFVPVDEFNENYEKMAENIRCK